MRHLAALIASAVAGFGGVAAVSAGPAGSAGSMSASASVVTALPTGHFRNAQPVLGPGQAGVHATFIHVSCPHNGGCAEGGTMASDAAGLQAFAAFEQHDGSWGTEAPVLLPDPAFTTSVLHEVSCGAPGNCVFVGDFDAANSFNFGNFGFYSVEKNGKFIQAGSVSGKGVRSEALTVSCPTAGDCAVGGKANGQPFTLDEANGTWGLPQPVAGLAALHEVSGWVQEISCASPGNCVAVGTYHDDSTFDRAFVVDESAGTWGPAQQVDTSVLKDSGADPTSVSCATPGNCAVGGTYLDSKNNLQDFVADEADGQWKPAQQVPGLANTGQFPGLFQLSCAAPGECVAVGQFDTTDSHAFIADERDGSWQHARSPGGAGSAATSVACSSARNCVVTGFAASGRVKRAFAILEVNGAWGKVNSLPGIAALDAGDFSEGDQVSCASAGRCAIGGEFVANLPSAPFATDSSPATGTSLTLSVRQVRSGQEQKEKLSVEVAPRAGGTPGGTVTVRAGTKAVCAIRLAKAKGSCQLGPRELKPGQYQLTASYGGSQTYNASKSGPMTLTISK